jgi:hypothetical protein
MKEDALALKALDKTRSTDELRIYGNFFGRVVILGSISGLLV